MNKARQLRALDASTLVAMLDDRTTRFDALETLEAKGSEALPAVQRLVELLREEDQLVVTKVLRTLGAIGPAAQAALPALRELAKDKDYLIRNYAQAALKSISPSVAT
jgi:HEAT repeat protein